MAVEQTSERPSGTLSSMERGHIENVDMYFRLSNDALQMLRDEASATGRSVAGLFRKRAGAMLADRNPQFAISAEKCSRYFGVEVSERMLGRLHRFGDARGIPHAALGELVASYIWRGGFRP
ncbi:hypothetical protein LDP08_15880 [Ralstonia pseudosolanacearum]|uniref:hypothetical protein n=1 Tax=Ralstonia pseudosolanacearum TaxID=1310165 RepID=UPI003CE90232